MNAFSNAVLALCMVAVGVLMTNHYTTDIRPPLVLHNFTVLTPVVAAGGQIDYQAVYDKRKECHPPLGGGEVRYRFASIDAGVEGNLIRENVEGIKRTSWPAGHGLLGTGAANVPRDLPPGRYSVTGTAEYSCANAPYLLRTVTPPMIVVVLAK